MSKIQRAYVVLKGAIILRDNFADKSAYQKGFTDGIKEAMKAVKLILDEKNG